MCSVDQLNPKVIAVIQYFFGTGSSSAKAVIYSSHQTAQKYQFRMKISMYTAASNLIFNLLFEKEKLAFTTLNGLIS